ncbi:MAG TPA: cysteine desulfurase family protein [Fimbriimonas sp.]|nr:cysteine desulfurase family protein [Fimbriimonas sp.]
MTDRYFDNAATTPVDPRVLEEMLPFFKDDFGNANSIHSFGRQAMGAVDLARQRVADLIEAEDPSQIFFTSGATEANNWLLRGFKDIAISPYEHSSLFEAAKHLGKRVLTPDFKSIGNPEVLSVMTVNNETGQVWDVREWSGQAAAIHADATQALGKIPFSVAGLDYASFSAHKLYGPKGIGALYAKENPPEPFLLGGEQESGYRAGTLNVPGIVGFGAAAAIALDEREQNEQMAASLRAELLDKLAPISEKNVIGGAKTSPFILSISFAGVEGESLVVELDRAGYAVSSGAACSSRSTEPSHVLLAMGLEEIWVRGTVRISFGRMNTFESVNGLARTLTQSVEKLRTMSRRLAK